MTEPLAALAGRRIVVGVSGSIAAYKAVGLVRLLLERGAVVDVAMTRAATSFVGPLTFASLTHRPVLDDVMELDAEQQIAHIELAEAADAIVLAPATANLLGELAAGLVDDAVTAIACASRAPVIVAPAMDAGMWTHPATQRNVATLREYGYLIVEPEVGELASGLTGIGRLAEPPTIVAAVEHLFARAGDLEGLHVVVSAGGTREPLDPVRFLGNRSSGKQGYALATVAAARGAEVTLVAANTALAAPAGVRVVPVQTALELQQAVAEAADEADVVIMAAAVADFRPAAYAASKIKKSHDPAAPEAAPTIELVRNPDILAGLVAAMMTRAETSTPPIRITPLLPPVRVVRLMPGPRVRRSAGERPDPIPTPSGDRRPWSTERELDTALASAAIAVPSRRRTRTERAPTSAPGGSEQLVQKIEEVVFQLVRHRAIAPGVELDLRRPRARERAHGWPSIHPGILPLRGVRTRCVRRR